MGPVFTAAAQIALFPTYTQTGAPVTMATAVHPANVTIGNGWTMPKDTAKAWVGISGCAYPNPYDATKLADLPTGKCTVGGKREFTNDKPIPAATPTPTPTPAPRY